MNKLDSLKELIKSLNKEAVRLTLLTLLNAGELREIRAFVIGASCYIRNDHTDFIKLNKIKLLLR